VQRAKEYLERQAKRDAYQTNPKAWQRQQVNKQLSRKMQSDSSSDASSTCADTASLSSRFEGFQERACAEILQRATNAVFALSIQEEKEARKVERKLRDITRLQIELDRGCALDKLQLEKMQMKGALESLLVMQKIRAGAQRPTI